MNTEQISGCRITWINSLSSTLVSVTKAVVIMWQLGLTSVLYSRVTVPGTVDKRCQLQPATAMFSVLSSVMVAIVRA